MVEVDRDGTSKALPVAVDASLRLNDYNAYLPEDRRFCTAGLVNAMTIDFPEPIAAATIVFGCFTDEVLGK